MTRHFEFVLALALLAGAVYPAKSMAQQPEEEQQLNEDASPDIEEVEMLLKQLEDLVEEEVMAGNNGIDDHMAGLFGKRHLSDFSGLTLDVAGVSSATGDLHDPIHDDPNVALGRPTRQSSTGHEGDPARAVDGNRSPHWADNSCTHTNEENDPWWYVDLGRQVTIDHVAIVNRRDRRKRITPFDVHVGDSTNVASNPRCGGHHHFPRPETEKVVNCGGLRGRYVGIRLPGRKRVLTLCEVEVYAAPNLALGKPTSQSNVAHNGVASRATDGCRDPNFGRQCCTRTPAEANPWLQVDLGTSVRVQWVVIMNRADCCRERLTPFNVHIGNNARVDQNPRCGGHHTIPAGKNKDAINCNGLTGRYVGIRLPGYGRMLTVCEIEVYTGTVTKRTSEVRETEGTGCGEHEVLPPDGPIGLWQKVLTSSDQVETSLSSRDYSSVTVVLNVIAEDLDYISVSGADMSSALIQQCFGDLLQQARRTALSSTPPPYRTSSRNVFAKDWNSASSTAELLRLLSLPTGDELEVCHIFYGRSTVNKNYKWNSYTNVSFTIPV
ncbi:PREDICTED: uncharacterized protein LOC109474779 [Branchiostoma belcheri]|uniref:Uncharacterized protein LOC109474779 n=1 Tax=Branchiostoma belcheri TaxID=7741 RepID=A0A6P4Z9U4_BRABE|nr:PREDICTED: uncharacterized protein LOC109474779 [Branchiostoma belcheri]